MKENVLDVLMYLFENYMEEGSEFHPDQDALVTELTQAGFARHDIHKAFSWLEDLSVVRAHRARLPWRDEGRALRHYTLEECARLDLECRGFLQRMEALGVIDATTRELVIDRVMALEVEDIGLDELKWVMLMVLYNQPGQEQAARLLEELVYNKPQGWLH
jgi:Smg protein